MKTIYFFFYLILTFYLKSHWEFEPPTLRTFDVYAALQLTRLTWNMMKCVTILYTIYIHHTLKVSYKSVLSILERSQTI